MSSPKVDRVPMPMILFMMHVILHTLYSLHTAICRRQMTRDFIPDICDKICVIQFLLNKSTFRFLDDDDVIKE